VKENELEMKTTLKIKQQKNILVGPHYIMFCKNIRSLDVGSSKIKSANLFCKTNVIIRALFWRPNKIGSVFFYNSISLTIRIITVQNL